MVVDRRDHMQYLTVSKSYSDNCKCSLTEQNITLMLSSHQRRFDGALKRRAKRHQSVTKLD